MPKTLENCKLDVTIASLFSGRLFCIGTVNAVKVPVDPNPTKTAIIITKLYSIFRLVYPHANIPIPIDAKPLIAMGKVNLGFEIK